MGRPGRMTGSLSADKKAGGARQARSRRTGRPVERDRLASGREEGRQSVTGSLSADRKTGEKQWSAKGISPTGVKGRQR